MGPKQTSTHRMLLASSKQFLQPRMQPGADLEWNLIRPDLADDLQRLSDRVVDERATAAFCQVLLYGVPHLWRDLAVEIVRKFSQYMSAVEHDYISPFCADGRRKLVASAS